MGMDGVELVMEIEEAFGCTIPDAAAEKMATPRDVIDWLVAEQERGGLFSQPQGPQPPPSTGVLRRWLGVQSRPSIRMEERGYSRDEIREAIFGIVREQLAVDKVWEDAHFVRDLGLG